MFKFRKPKPTFETIRTEDLQVGDRFNYTQAEVEVKAITLTETHAVVDIEANDPGTRAMSRTVSLYREQFIIVPR